MSKAFVRESDEASEQPVTAVPISALPPGARNYLTAQGAQRLREELRSLRTERRPSLADRAAEDADAKAELAAVDQRIRYLQQVLFSADVVANPPGATDRVRFGTTVGVREADDTEAYYRIVGVNETDPEAGAISWVSPLAQALMNAQAGDEVDVSTPSGTTHLRIDTIRYD